MKNTHQQVFGCSIAERKQRLAGRWQEEGIDYSAFYAPAFVRARGNKRLVT